MGLSRFPEKTCVTAFNREPCHWTVPGSLQAKQWVQSHKGTVPGYQVIRKM